MNTEYHTVKASFANPERDKVDTDISRAALAGETGTAMARDFNSVMSLTSYGSLKVMDVTWAVLAEIDADEALLPVKNLRNAMVLLAIVGGCGRTY